MIDHFQEKNSSNIHLAMGLSILQIGSNNVVSVSVVPNSMITLKNKTFQVDSNLNKMDSSPLSTWKYKNIISNVCVPHSTWIIYYVKRI